MKCLCELPSKVCGGRNGGKENFTTWSVDKTQNLRASLKRLFGKNKPKKTSTS